jgi:hypothetical protein
MSLEHIPAVPFSQGVCKSFIDFILRPEHPSFQAQFDSQREHTWRMKGVDEQSGRAHGACTSATAHYACCWPRPVSQYTVVRLSEETPEIAPRRFAPSLRCCLDSASSSQAPLPSWSPSHSSTHRLGHTEPTIIPPFKDCNVGFCCGR